MIPTLYEPFRHWSEKGSVYILSDLHFDDADCKFMSPDWITPQEQIEIINRIVMKNDTFICLGDVGSPEYLKDIKARNKILILGNHDAKGAYKNYFDEIYIGPLFIAEKILLSHEPVHGLPWCLNIHGHDHNHMEPYKEGCKRCLNAFRQYWKIGEPRKKRRWLMVMRDFCFWIKTDFRK